MVPLLLLLLTLPLLAAAQQSCQLCMQTYKLNCSICYDPCIQTKPMTSCTSYNCTSRNPDGTCNQTIATIHSAGTCLGACCAGLEGAGVFDQGSFNLCIERDNYVVSNINIGLNLGVILGFVVLLQAAGLAYLYYLKTNRRKYTQHQLPTTNEDLRTHRPQQKGLSPHQHNEAAWLTQHHEINGVCPLCQVDGINIVANCDHGFHYTCLAGTIQQSSSCPLCRKPDSLDSAKIYCSACHEHYQLLTLEKLDPVTGQALAQLKCPHCLQ